jgi:hypothetical protein
MGTAIWVPLAVAALGIVGVLVTQWRADIRADKVWKREREAQRWAREDRTKTFDQRRQNYSDFYTALKTMVEVASERAHATEPNELPPNFGEDAGAQLQLMELYGSAAVVHTARMAFHRAQALDRDSHRIGHDPEIMEFEYDQAETDLLNAMRTDLGVPGAFAPVDPERGADWRTLKPTS